MKKVYIMCVILFVSISAVSAKPVTLAEVVIEHLSYLGYKCTIDNNVISAKHHLKPGFDIQTLNNGILFRAWFQHKDFPAEKTSDYIRIVNSLNISTTVANFYVDRDLDLIIEAWYPRPYSRKSFSNFVSTWEHDFATILQQSRDLLKDFLA